MSLQSPTETIVNGKYFDMVQAKIQEILAQDSEKRKFTGKGKFAIDSEITPEQFSDLIFNQNDTQKDADVSLDVKNMIDNAAKHNGDIDKISREILDTYYPRVKNNVDTKDTVNDVPNQLEERRIMTFEKFKNS